MSAVLAENVDLFRIREAYRRKVKEEVDKNWIPDEKNRTDFGID